MMNFQEAIAVLENEARRLEIFINSQSSAYVQIEDMGATMQRVDALREAANLLRSMTTYSVDAASTTHFTEEDAETSGLIAVLPT